MFTPPTTAACSRPRPQRLQPRGAARPGTEEQAVSMVCAGPRRSKTLPIRLAEDRQRVAGHEQAVAGGGVGQAQFRVVGRARRRRRPPTLRSGQRVRRAGRHPRRPRAPLPAARAAAGPSPPPRAGRCRRRRRRSRQRRRACRRRRCRSCPARRGADGGSAPGRSGPAGTVVTASRPSSSRVQKASRSGAPGRRQAAPRMAMASPRAATRRRRGPQPHAAAGSAAGVRARRCAMRHRRDRRGPRPDAARPPRGGRRDPAVPAPRGGGATGSAVARAAMARSSNPSTAAKCASQLGRRQPAHAARAARARRG